MILVNKMGQEIFFFGDILTEFYIYCLSFSKCFPIKLINSYLCKKK